MSTVAEEIADNLYLMITDFRDKARVEPILVMDNIRIQSCIPADYIRSRYGDIILSAGQRDKLPAHSPDLNQPAEQGVCAVKGDVIGQLADFAQRLDPHKCCITADQLRMMGKRAAENFAKGACFKGGVENSVHRMPDVWRVVAADADEMVVVQGHGNQQGTAGDWAPAGLR